SRTIYMFFWYLLKNQLVAAQAKMQERALPQWLTGIIAVSGFLFLAFVGFLVKKAWCEEPRRSCNVMFCAFIICTIENIYESSPGTVRSKDDMNAYDNLVMDGTEDKVTSM
uniref:Uncharacterized protein n=1 Tax=Gasterosteus aculeatus TaxID=69293 RepID=G3NFS0_GASAC